MTGDKNEHHVLDRPRNAPTRTAFGVAAMTAYAMLWIAGGNDLVATQFSVSLNSVTYFLRVAVFVAPVLAFLLTKRICVALQRSDPERLLHGAETGVIERDPSGGTPSATARSRRGGLHAHPAQGEPLPPAATGRMPDKELKSENRRPPGNPLLVLDSLRKPSRAELEDAAHHHDGAGHEIEGDGNGHHALTSGEAEHMAK